MTSPVLELVRWKPVWCRKVRRHVGRNIFLLPGHCDCRPVPLCAFPFLVCSTQQAPSTIKINILRLESCTIIIYWRGPSSWKFVTLPFSYFARHLRQSFFGKAFSSSLWSKRYYFCLLEKSRDSFVRLVRDSSNLHRLALASPVSHSVGTPWTTVCTPAASTEGREQSVMIRN